MDTNSNGGSFLFPLPANELMWVLMLAHFLALFSYIIIEEFPELKRVQQNNIDTKLKYWEAIQNKTILFVSCVKFDECYLSADKLVT